MKLLQIVITIAIAVLSAVFTAKISTARWQGSFLKLSLIGGFLSVLTAFGSILLDGLGMSNVQTILLSCVFLYASYGDIKTHEADDFIHILVLAVALIVKPAAQMPESIISAIIIGGVMLLVACFVPGANIGGADIKFVAACAFLTSFDGAIFGFGLGTFAALIFNSPFRKKEGAGEPYPMLPYLSCAYMLVHLLF